MQAMLSSTLVPAVYIGLQKGVRGFPAIELYNLLAPIGEHPVGSTVGRSTLERYGWRLLTQTRRVGQRPRGEFQNS